MNNILELKGKRFRQAARTGGGGSISMNGNKDVTTEHLQNLKLQLDLVKKFWIEEEINLFDGVLVTVYYNKIAAKSNRISGLLKKEKSSNAIVGAKFNDKKNKHIITYYVDFKDLDESIKLLDKTSAILDKYFNGYMDKEKFDNKDNFKPSIFRRSFLSMSKFKQVIADASYTEFFGVEKAKRKPGQRIITFYNVEKNMEDLLRGIGIDPLEVKVIDDQTICVYEKEAKLLFDTVPYLISMSTVDINEISPDIFSDQYNKNEITKISSSHLEQVVPTIGVIDTLFDESVYFNEWVEYHDMVGKNITRDRDDYEHGTAVASIIVDGPRLNPWLDDGCGRFKVRLFGIAVSQRFSFYNTIKKIDKIVLNNPDIKVWNISFGSMQEINDNYISVFGALLDKIQYENDVVFVVAGTNKNNFSDDIVKIGAPADSINSVVVNSVTKFKKPTKYARAGIALSFFAKPDISYYGGSNEEYINVCGAGGIIKKGQGTSYAAPWIARKLSYLIDVLGFSREIAKALIIDSARGWNNNLTFDEIAFLGHGVVPIKIEDIIHTPKDEIKFLVSDVSEKWNSYNYDFPVPLVNNKYPYVARATMCYFPVCNRLQGVDYTNTELNIHFGRINDKGKIVDIKGDKQNQDDVAGDPKYYLYEAEARRQFRKWDNVKYVVENIEKKVRPRKSYINNKTNQINNWGMEVKANNRLNSNDGQGLRFGVVVTLKAIDGVNRIDEFIMNCSLNGWLVDVVDVSNRIKIYHTAQEKIELD